MLIAVKVVEHTGEQQSGRTDIVEGARESLLAASVSHPNVIPCYKVRPCAAVRHPVSLVHLTSRQGACSCCMLCALSSSLGSKKVLSCPVQRRGVLCRH